MTDEPKAGSSSPQSDYVQRVRPNPAEHPEPAISLVGLNGESDRQGFRRLYLDKTLCYHVEFKPEDVVREETLPPSALPLLGLESTRVSLRPGSPVDFTRSHTLTTGDEFDISATFSNGRSTRDSPPSFAFCSVFCSAGCGTDRSDCYCRTDNCRSADC